MCKEQDQPWLQTLLDIYALIDSWIAEEKERKGVNPKIVCSKGCGQCCKILTIPINHLEFRGLCWYISEILPMEERLMIKKRIHMYDFEEGCPFLIKEACLVYPVRPLACRQFFVLNKPCTEGIHPWLERREDIFCAIDSKISWLIATKYLPLYGIKDESEQRKAFEQGYLHECDQPLTSYDWTGLSVRL